MIDSEFVGYGSFSEVELFNEFANKYGNKGSKNWKLPKWEELKLIHPHQLRVHAAHHLGLNCPIIGDDLYGKKQIDFTCTPLKLSSHILS